MIISDRYASAIRSNRLTVDAKTTMSDTDVLGAMGLADRELTTGKDSQGNDVHPAPLAVALERLFAGDNSAAFTIVDVLARMAWGRAKASRILLRRTEAKDMARACLAWHRDGTCKPCGGHGTLVIPGSSTLGAVRCKKCKGTGALAFETQFELELVPIAAWLVAEMQRDMSRAGPAAMRKIAPSLDL
jgi:hypothetical protein